MRWSCPKQCGKRCCKKAPTSLSVTRKCETLALLMSGHTAAEADSAARRIQEHIEDAKAKVDQNVQYVQHAIAKVRAQEYTLVL